MAAEAALAQALQRAVLEAGLVAQVPAEIDRRALAAALAAQDEDTALALILILAAAES
jgi:hypothetical protein